MNLEIGKAYFDISWANNESQVPDIETYISIGKNVFGEEPDEYFFQTSHSYETDGNFAEQKDQTKKAKAEIILMRSDMVETLYSIGELIDHLMKLKDTSGAVFGRIDRHNHEDSS